MNNLSRYTGVYDGSITNGMDFMAMGEGLFGLFKKEKGLFQREVNEHLILNGQAGYLKYDFCDNNKKSFHEWFLKHLVYAKKEATDLYLQNKF